MRTLVATVLANNKGKEIYCWNRKVSNRDAQILRDSRRSSLQERGFTFIRMISLEFPNVAGYAIFYEGHLDEMSRELKALEMGP
ncbi:MAG: hypothetical protein ACOX0F_12585 [Syntrophomonadaceae bacterium]|jgi:hypothetical protein